MAEKNENGFFDIHSHVIYGVDDGARNIENSLEMLKQSYAEGVRTLVATPHNYPGHDDKIEIIKERYEILKDKALEIGDDFKLLLGNEILYRKSIVEDLANGKCLTMNNSRAVLIEFYPSESYRTIYDGLLELVREGYIPIIAHIERVKCLHENDRYLRDLKEMGVYFQVNTEIITGGLFNKMTKRILYLFEMGMIDFLGSDCHNMSDRAPRFIKASRQLNKKRLNYRFDNYNSCDIMI